MSRSKRRDSKHRVLRNGESIRADGKYQFKYYVGGKIKFVYSWRLEPTDPVPKGKRPGPSLREMEKQIAIAMAATRMLRSFSLLMALGKSVPWKR